MASFDVSYIIKAIDKVSPTVDKILDSLGNLDRATEASGVDFDKFQNAIDKAADKIARSIGKMSNLVTHDIRKVNDSLQSIKTPRITPIKVSMPDTRPAEKSFHRFLGTLNHGMELFSEKADQIALKGFYNMMNIMMPLMAFIKPFQDVMQQQQAITAMRIQGFSQSDIKKLREQAGAIVKSSAFDKGALIKVQAMLASHHATVQTISKLLPDIAAVAAATNETLAQAANQVNQAIWGKGKKIVGSLVVQGGSQAQRVADLTRQIGKQYPEALQKQMQSASGQLRNAGNQIGDSLQKIVTQGLPPLIQMAKVFAKAASAVGDWMSKHQKLVKFFVYATGVVLGLVFAQMAAGAAMSGIGLIMGGLKGATMGVIHTFKGIVGVLKLLRKLILFSPAGAIVLGLTALGAATYEIYHHWGQITKAVKRFINEHPKLRAMINAIKKGFRDIAHFIDNAVSGLGEFLHKIGLSKNAIHGLGKAFSILMGAGILIFFGKLAHLVGKLTGLSGVVKSVKKLAGFGSKTVETAGKDVARPGIIGRALSFLGKGVKVAGASAADIATAAVTSTSGIATAGIAGLLMPTEAGDSSRFSTAQMAQMLKEHPEWRMKKIPSTNLGSTVVHNHNHNKNVNNVYIDGKKHSTATNKSSGFSQTYIGTPTLFLP